MSAIIFFVVEKSEAGRMLRTAKFVGTVRKQAVSIVLLGVVKLLNSNLGCVVSLALGMKPSKGSPLSPPKQQIAGIKMVSSAGRNFTQGGEFPSHHCQARDPSDCQISNPHVSSDGELPGKK